MSRETAAPAATAPARTAGLGERVTARILAAAWRRLAGPGGVVLASRRVLRVNASRWPLPARVPILETGEVHLWRCLVPEDEASLARLQRRLDGGERERAARMRHDETRARFVTARTALRHLGAAYLGCTPSELLIAAGPWGKLGFAGPGDAARLRFSLSHAGRIALLAFGLDRELGVDVESTARNIDWRRLAVRFFHPEETSALLALPARRRRAAFFLAWSCKEALGKAHGEGLGPVLGVRVMPLPLGDEPVAVAPEGEPAGAGWLLRRLRPGRGYTGALACAPGYRTVRRLAWSPQLR